MVVEVDVVVRAAPGDDAIEVVCSHVATVHAREVRPDDESATMAAPDTEAREAMLYRPSHLRATSASNIRGER
jgi:hypothetical protein